MPLDADLVLVNARILTQDDARPEASALAARGEEIVYVGDDAGARALAGSGTRIIDGGGRVVTPGFIDAHTHLVQFGMQLLRLNLARTRSLDEVHQHVVERAKLTPSGGWIVGYGWDESKWGGDPMPARAGLDAVAPDHPVILARVDMHMGVANSRALDAAGLAPAGFQDGLLRENDFYRAFDMVSPATETLVKGLSRATRACWDAGVTSCHVIADARDVRALEAARRGGHLGVRCTVYYRVESLDALVATGLEPPFGDPWLKLGGLKLFTDGSIGSRTAAVTRGYAEDPDAHGELVYARDVLHGLVARAHAANLQVALHCIGDTAVEEALDAVASAVEEAPRADHRHRLEHLELFTDDHVARIMDLGVIASCQPNFVGEWGHAGQMYETRLGPWVVPAHNRFRRLLDAGVPLAFGSDHMPFGPLYGIHCAVNGPTDSQRITVDEALAAYTRGAAFAARDDGRVGVLKPGALADFIALAEDPREASARIKDNRVVLTVAGGRIVHDVA